MECTPSWAARLVELLDGDSDTSSGSSSNCEEGRQNAGYASRAESPRPEQLPVMDPKQEIEVIVISSGDESSDAEGESADKAGVRQTARGNGAKAARTVAPSVSAMRQRYEECLKAYDAWTSRQEQSRNAPAEQPAVEVDGILAAAIEEYSKLEDDDQCISRVHREHWTPEASTGFEHGKAAVESVPTIRKADQRQHDHVHKMHETRVRCSYSNAHHSDVDSKLDETKAGQRLEPETSDNRTKAVLLASTEEEMQCRRSEQFESKRRKEMLSNGPSFHVRIEQQRKLPRISQVSFGNIATMTEPREKSIIIEAQNSAQNSSTRKSILKPGRGAGKTQGQHARDNMAKAKDSKKQLIALAQKIDFSSRQQLLDVRANLRNEKRFGHQQRSAQATDSNGKTKLARRNKRRRQNKAKRNSGVSIES
ncbi:hypothetical protein CERZMDRAFT_96827 [Cercospora zeae-maydis SCOH1-5]|uniref:Uncharacterized protein n=1 Tax=Cercospora zeae-maydis SCOH1-5 TaxID=717836 RepID=A0A6A6FI44_9PEZI|nr:hypothetical protein CERZMDRAFT_96827 [Cercospora zeae-maydis SCOH1-5]